MLIVGAILLLVLVLVVLSRGFTSGISMTFNLSSAERRGTGPDRPASFAPSGTCDNPSILNHPK
jgi:hypothetical protein